MALTNLPKPTTSLTNASRASSGETWGTITSTWGSETRTWEQSGSNITNDIRIAEMIWDEWISIWNEEARTWDQLGAGITNTSKPS